MSKLKCLFTFPVVLIAFLIIGAVNNAGLAWAGFTQSGSSVSGRESHSATMLPDGKILITGGRVHNGSALNTAEIYDPVTGQFTNTSGNMTIGRYLHTATLLPNGKVLITGGMGPSSVSLNTAELFDPATGIFTVTASPMTTSRENHTATMLSDGRVLIAGGGIFSSLNTSEIYDPAVDAFSSSGNMIASRSGHSATLLTDGKVLIAGGISGYTTLNTAEIYNPAAGVFTSTSWNMTSSRTDFTATLLHNGDVLLCGGYLNSTGIKTCDTYNPATGKFTATSGQMAYGRTGHTATLLPDGRVLIAGGYDAGFSSTATSEIYNPATRTFTTLENMTSARTDHTAILLPLSFKVVIIGGYNGSGETNTSEVFNNAVSGNDVYQMNIGSVHYYRLEIPQNHNGLRIVMSSTASSQIILYDSGFPSTTAPIIASSDNSFLHTLLVAPESLQSGKVYHLRVYAYANLTYQFTATEFVYARDIIWDPGTDPNGTEITGTDVVPNGLDTGGGDYLFRINTQTSNFGAWRTALKVIGGEASLHIQQNTPPLNNSATYNSIRIGSDGIILASPQFSNNQTWYIKVSATPGSRWLLYSGDIYVYDMLNLAEYPDTDTYIAGNPPTDNSISKADVTIGPEGMVFFKTLVDANTPAWRMYLNGDNLPIYVKKNSAPTSLSGYYEQTETGQVLLVPPYLINGTYFIGVAGAPDIPVKFDSRKQEIKIPVSDTFSFSLTGNDDAGYGYITYQVNVPSNQIAWQINCDPTNGNADLYIRQGEVPNRWNNSGLSEAGASAIDSITQVPPILTNGVWYITVYGTGSFSFNLTSGNPVITDISFININPPVTNDLVRQSGWRYYRIGSTPQEIAVQLGYLGWELELANQVAGTEIALRRNAVPSRWRYRNNGNTTVTESAQVDFSSKTGLLQRPNHPADVWYIGIYIPDQALGAFSLTTRGIPYPDLAFNSGIKTVIGQTASIWNFYKVNVPNGALGWDLRLTDITGGTPCMVVRRDQLPSSFQTTSDSSHSLTQSNTWPTGWQWGAGGDWTGRSYNADGTVNYSQYIIAGMGSPLEPGTYYIGVSSCYSSYTTPLSYTIKSRGIGIGSDSANIPWAIQVADLPFTGSVSSGVNGISPLAPREAAYYRVTVPVNTKSWKMDLIPSGGGEALMAIRRSALPNVMAASNCDSDRELTNGYYGCGYTGTTRQKSGQEYFYKYPTSSQNAIPDGVYYIAVVSEGNNPISSNRIGTGAVDYTLTSYGEVQIDDKTGTPLAIGSNVTWTGESLLYGQQKVYRFRVPASPPILSMEVRLKNKVGNPVITIRKDNVDAGRTPSPLESGYYASEGGDGTIASTNNSDIITITSPAGDYTMIVSANSLYQNSTWTYPDASFDIEVVAQGEIPVSFNGGNYTVTTLDPQPANTWRYYKVIVPERESVALPNGALGWDLRLTGVTGGTPCMVVRRDQLPTNFTTSSNPTTYTSNTWRTGWQWGAGGDWTRRGTNADGTTDYSSYIIAGMGSPLEPGTYYIGVSSCNITYYTAPMSYTIKSRGIGIGSDSANIPWAIQVADLPFTGNVSSGVNGISALAPREAAYYRVTVPANTKSWKMDLIPSGGGEALMAIRRGVLPNVEANNFSSCGSDSTLNPGCGYTGTKRQKSGQEYFYKYSGYSQNAISDGVYYIAVVSEGNNPPYSYQIGTGAVDYTLTSYGEVQIDDKTATPLAIGSNVTWTGESLLYGQQKVYRFRVPAFPPILSMEVRLKNKVGNPMLVIRQDNVDAGRIPAPLYTSYYLASEGGDSQLTYTYNSDIITITYPAGDYTMIVSTDSLYQNSTLTYPDASFDIEVTAKEIKAVLNNFTNPDGDTQTGILVDQQVEYYKIDVPAFFDGANVPGLKFRLTSSVGNATLCIRKDNIPDVLNRYYKGTFCSSDMVTIFSAPYLTPGTWYVEVKGTGLTEYTLTTSIVRADRTWTMPAKGEQFNQQGLQAPYIGDSGIDDNGNPIMLDTGDIGTYLPKDDYHFYKVNIPNNNAGLMRTMLMAISGDPDMYIRQDIPPILNLQTNDNYKPGSIYDRYHTGSGTLYGNWVPLNGMKETQLTPGEWWIAVKGSYSNIKYRLVISAGAVPDGNGQLQDTEGFVQDLLQDGGSKTGQSLAAGDMRFYRVVIPQSSITNSISTPLNWKINFIQQSGDVVLFIRDTVPPGFSNRGSYLNVASYGSDFQDWYDDNSSIASPNPYVVFDNPGTYDLTLPPVKPGHTYYIGVFAKTDAAFDISSSIGPERIALTGIINFYGGTTTRTLNPGEQVIYRVDVPAEATRWKQSAQHDAGIKLYLHQGTVPPRTSYAHWYSWSSANTTVNQVLFGPNNGNYPWQPGHSYYLLVENTTAGPLPFTFTMDGRNRETDSEDIEKDGLPDWWELKYFNNIYNYSPSSDPDGDGLNNLAEFQSDTDPMNPDIQPPTGSVLINNGDSYSSTVSVTLTLTAVDNPNHTAYIQVYLSNDGTGWTSAGYFSLNKIWTLSAGDGIKTVYVKFRDKAGNWSTVYSDSIILDTVGPTCLDNDNDGYGNPPDPTCLNGNVVDCDDNNAAINHGATELCDGVDNNCSGTFDETFTNLGAVCGNGTGACTTVGTMVCSQDGLSTVCNAGLPPDSDGDGIPDCEDTDDDNDGLPDTWELQYGLNPLDPNGNDGANGDPDGDGFSNSAEFTGGSNPGDPLSIPNHSPLVNAGADQNVLTGSQVMLDGSASSDPDGDLITYNWTKTCNPNGSVVTLSDATVPKPVFTPDLAGSYCFDLTVCDAWICSGPDSVVIYAAIPNVPPNANAGADQNVFTGLPLLLDGSASNDPDNGPSALSYQWSFVSTPAGSIMTNNDIAGINLPLAGFTPDVAGGYEIDLAVSDGIGTAHDQVIITADVNVPPVANAGLDQVVMLGQGVTLDGSGSYDQDGLPMPVTYQWSFVSIPAGSVLTNGSITAVNSDVAGIMPDMAGSYVLQLAVSDGQATTTDNVVVIVDGAVPTGSISINNNAVWTKTSTVMLTLNCTDNVGGSGCADMQVSRDGVFDTEPWEAYTNSKVWTLNTGNGNRAVHVRYRDMAGNVSLKYTDSINLDIAKPVISGVSDTPDPFDHHLGGNTKISFTVSDNLSATCDAGVKIYNSSNVLVKTIIRTGISCPVAGAITSVTWSGKDNSGALVPAGTYTYKVQARDKAQNYSVIQSGQSTVQ